MNIVNFTPITATLGGMIIGLAVVIFFLFNGRLVGILLIAVTLLTLILPVLFVFIVNRSKYKTIE